MSVNDFYLEGGKPVESCGMNRFRGDIGDVRDKILQVFTRMLQMGGVDDNLN